MKIDIVTDTFPPDINGVANTLNHLSKTLTERGHTIRIIRSKGADDQEDAFANSLPLPGYKEIRIGLPSPIKFRKRWIRKRPDAVYVATESPLGVSAVTVAKNMDIPVVTGFHTNFHQYMEKYRLGILRNTAKNYLTQLHKRADLTLAPSVEAVKMLESEGVTNVKLLGRGVDTIQFHPNKKDEALRATWQVNDDAHVYLSVGRLAAEKNLSLCIQAMAQVRDKNPNAKFIIVGDGPLRASLEKENPWIIFTGALVGEELAKHYASADFLLFSSTTETFGNVVLEGMASGLVVIAFDYAAAKQHIVNDINGISVTMGDELLWQAVAAQEYAPEKISALRQQARTTVETQGWQDITAQFESYLVTAANAKQPVFEDDGTKKSLEPFACRTVIISDLHLGTVDAKAEEVVSFLKSIKCDKLILNGDFIDGWALKRGAAWSVRHSRVIRIILKKMEKEQTKVIYTRGNHDDILERFMPISFGSLQILKEHIHHTADGKKYLIVHGDGFDSIATNHKWMAKIGSIGYDSLLKINRIYNLYRSFRGKEYYSLSKAVKAKVKSAVSFVDEYEKQLEKLAIHKKCDGIICGHIHTPADKQLETIHYLNSGDWVESLTAIIEHSDGRMEVVEYKKFMLERFADSF